MIVKQLLELVVAYIAIDHHMVVVEVQIDRNIVGNVLPYNLQMSNQTTMDPLGLIWDVWVFIHDIPYNVIFIVMHNIDSTYFMLLGRP